MVSYPTSSKNLGRTLTKTFFKPFVRHVLNNIFVKIPSCAILPRNILHFRAHRWVNINLCTFWRLHLCMGTARGSSALQSEVIGNPSHKKVLSLGGARTHNTRGKEFSIHMLYHWAIEASNWNWQNLDSKWIYAFSIIFQFKGLHGKANKWFTLTSSNSGTFFFTKYRSISNF